MVKGTSKAIEKANRDFKNEMMKQVDVLTASFCIAMHRNKGWNCKRLSKVVQEIRNVLEECSMDPNMSMMKMLEKETGVEMQNGSGVSYHSIHYLSGNSDLRIENMTPGQFLYMRKRQIEWVAPTVISGALIAMHRMYGYGPIRLQRLIEWVDDIRNAYKCDRLVLIKLCELETGVKISWDKHD